MIPTHRTSSQRPQALSRLRRFLTLLLHDLGGTRFPRMPGTAVARSPKASPGTGSRGWVSSAIEPATRHAGRATTPGTPPAVYLGILPGVGHLPPVELYNLLAPLGHHPKGSTVSRKTLEDHGFTPAVFPGEPAAGAGDLKKSA